MCGKTWHSMRNRDKKILKAISKEGIGIRIGKEETDCNYIVDFAGPNHLLTLAFKNYEHSMNNEFSKGCLKL